MNPLARYWAGRPLAIRPESLSALLGAADMSTAVPGATRFVGAQRAGSPFRMTEKGTAIITIDGALCNRGAFIGENYGLVSYEGLSFKLDAAGRDPQVRAIILDLESPGGEAIGCFELASQVRAIADAKPVYAIANSMACSAAYAIASGARAIVAAPSAITGSIGVVMLHADYSRMLDHAGITPTLIHAGAHKVDGSPYSPLSKEVRGDLQAEVDKFHSLFLATVEAGRGSRMSAAAARKTEARCYIGQEAQKVGLVDEIGSFAELLDEAERNSTRRAAPRPNARSAEVDLSRYSAGGDDRPEPEAGKPAGGAADWADVAAKLNSERAPLRSAAPASPEAKALAGEADRIPNQKGAVAWSDIADKLNAEAGRARQAKARGR